MVKVTSAAQAQKNYTDAAAYVPARFEAGVNAATWQQEALAGQDLYVQKLQDPEVLSRRSKNIAKVSDQEWRTQTVTKGRSVIGARMTAAAAKQQQNWQPYRAALESYTLPAKVADPQMNVINRVGGIVKVMTDTKAQVG